MDGSTDGSKGSSTGNHLSLRCTICLLAIVSSMLFLGFVAFVVGMLLRDHQYARQLRMPPLLGDSATRHFGSVLIGMATCGCIALLGCVWYAATYNTTRDIRLAFWAAFAGVPMTCALFAVFFTLDEDQRAAAKRASLRTKAALLKLELGDVPGTTTRLLEAQAELEGAVGPESTLMSPVARLASTFQQTYQAASNCSTEQYSRGHTGVQACRGAFRELRAALLAVRSRRVATSTPSEKGKSK